MPSLETPYLFNGDVTDRGERATEILLILFAFMVSCPGSVYMNRGNHEVRFNPISTPFQPRVNPISTPF